MSDVYKISQALEDLRNYYGLKEIKHVTLNMEKDHPEITFISNKPTQLSNWETHDKHTMPDKVKYVLQLNISIDSIYKEEDK